MRGFGVYLHLPFCLRRCDYCAFATWDDRAEVIDRYLMALRTEIDRGSPGRPAATSVFVGGGTPSLVDPADLAVVLARIDRLAGAEVTLEANPETLTADRLAGYRDAGVTRVSLGVQSFVDDVLDALGRDHDAATAVRAAELVAGAGFESWNIDLIYGARGEDLEAWRRSVEQAIDLGVPHLSAYGLTVETGTPLAAQPERWPDDDDLADKYLLADDLLDAAGLSWYEISNWALPGHECRHNLLYWTQGDYAAYGCAAHAHRGGRRSWNIRSLDRYLDAVESGRSAEAGSEMLDPDARRVEAAQLLLRTARGVPVEALPGHLDQDRLAGLVERRAGQAVLTRRGRLLANEVALCLT